MRIGIDGIALTIKFPCGTRMYAMEFLDHITKIDTKNDYIVFVPHSVGFPKRKNVQFKIIPFYFPYLKRQVSFPLCVHREHIDIFHYLHPYGALFFSHPKIVTTLHDIRLDKIFRSLYHPKYIFQNVYTHVTRIGVFHHTHTFISVSHATKDDFYQTFHIKKPVVVIPNGVAHEFFIQRTQGSLRKSYFLAFADYSPRKNIETVIEAYARLQDSIKKRFPLIIVLSTTFSYQRVLRYIQKFKVQEFVSFKVQIQQKELIGLYKHAYALLFPSLFEGFGLPIVEALASGCPVITSNFGAMKEVAGDAAYFVNPYSIQDLTIAISQILEKPNIAARLKRKGLERAKRFTWEETARKTLAVYERVYRS